MGWIEHYVDPQNMRAMFEGFVALVDKKRSEKYETLVKEADEIIPKLPWDKQFEREKFNAPDFSSLDVLTFAAESLPKGINIPNYADIREEVGFKNVIFENNKPMNKSLWQRNEYVTQEESEYLNEHSRDAYKVQVAGHELFGHGSGKLLFAQSGKCPESKDPMTNETFSSCYKEGENF
jgi:dipeptidyl-peptidase-3